MGKLNFHMIRLHYCYRSSLLHFISAFNFAKECVLLYDLYRSHGKSDCYFIHPQMMNYLVVLLFILVLILLFFSFASIWSYNLIAVFASPIGFHSHIFLCRFSLLLYILSSIRLLFCNISIFLIMLTFSILQRLPL